MARGDNPGYVPPEKRETPHDRAVRTAADEALHWIKKGEFTRNSTAIYRAMKNACLERTTSNYQQVKDALHALPEWKDMKQREKDDRQGERDLKALRKEQEMKQAYAHQMSQPRETWDNAYDPLDEDDD
jgi:hypothetical protein